MKNATSVVPVVEAGLCTGCGTCAGICPRNALAMTLDEGQGLYLPALDRERCNDCGLCLEVCPGHAVDFRQLNRCVFGKELDDVALGSYLDCSIGYATDHDVRFSSTSGGLVTALLTFALEEGVIDGALVTRMSRDKPLQPELFIARTKEEVVAAAKSKYCPVPVNVALKEILKADAGQRFAVVGLPCHIQGIRKAERVIKKLSGRVPLQFALVCSHSDSFNETAFLLRRYHVRKEDVTEISYRGHGWPGFLSIRTRDGAETAVPFHEYIRAHAGFFFTPRRCTLCCDMSGRLADISFMDAWLPEVLAKDNVGTSIIVSRTDRGQALCRSAGLKGRVELKPLPVSDVLRSQGGGRMTNRDLKAQFLFARVLGRTVPEYNIDVPRSGISNYLRALGIHLNMWVSSSKKLHGLIPPMIRIESRVIGKKRMTT